MLTTEQKLAFYQTFFASDADMAEAFLCAAPEALDSFLDDAIGEELCNSNPYDLEELYYHGFSEDDVDDVKRYLASL